MLVVPLACDGREFGRRPFTWSLIETKLDFFDHDSISFDSIVGKGVSLHIQTVDSERSMSGYISRFSRWEALPTHTQYDSWLAMLRNALSLFAD